MNRGVFSIVIWGLYGAALVLPAAVIPGPFTNGEMRFLGYEALFHGWEWPGTIPELANVALLIGWIAFLKGCPRHAAAAGALSVALSLSAPAVYQIEFSELGAGFFLWVASCLALAVPFVLEATRRAQRVPSPPSLVTLP